LVTNTGNVTITNPRVKEAGFTGKGSLSPITCPSAGTKLAPGEHVTCTATYTVTAADVAAGSIKNSATVTGTPPGGLTPPVSPPSSVTVVTRPNAYHLVVRKRVDGMHRVEVGQRVRFTITVANTGPDAAPAPLKVRDKLPKGLELVKARGTGWSCKVNKRTDVATCKAGAALAAGHSTAVLKVVAKSTRAALGHRLTNVATVSTAGSKATTRSNKTHVRVVRAPSVYNSYRLVPQERWLA
jgi:uncharacterized repeat protein (TIGR01451 family)